jgi:hypothetical protein
MTGIEQRDYDGLSKSNWNSAMFFSFICGFDFPKTETMAACVCRLEELYKNHIMLEFAKRIIMSLLFEGGREEERY